MKKAIPEEKQVASEALSLQNFFEKFVNIKEGAELMAFAPKRIVGMLELTFKLDFIDDLPSFLIWILSKEQGIQILMDHLELMKDITKEELNNPIGTGVYKGASLLLALTYHLRCTRVNTKKIFNNTDFLGKITTEGLHANEKCSPEEKPLFKGVSPLYYLFYYGQNDILIKLHEHIQSEHLTQPLHTYDLKHVIIPLSRAFSSHDCIKFAQVFREKITREALITIDLAEGTAPIHYIQSRLTIYRELKHLITEQDLDLRPSKFTKEKVLTPREHLQENTDFQNFLAELRQEKLKAQEKIKQTSIITIGITREKRKHSPSGGSQGTGKHPNTGPSSLTSK
jgi:hypothetical protein